MKPRPWTLDRELIAWSSAHVHHPARGFLAFPDWALNSAPSAIISPWDTAHAPSPNDQFLRPCNADGNRTFRALAFGDLMKFSTITRMITTFSSPHPPATYRWKHLETARSASFLSPGCYLAHYHSFNSSLWLLLPLRKAGKPTLSFLPRYRSLSSHRTFKRGCDKEQRRAP